jgi:hypothetical protein
VRARRDTRADLAELGLLANAVELVDATSAPALTRWRRDVDRCLRAPALAIDARLVEQQVLPRDGVHAVIDSDGRMRGVDLERARARCRRDGEIAALVFAHAPSSAERCR